METCKEVIILELTMDTSKLNSKQAQPGFFDFAAEVGLTKHLGGLEATENLLELCHIGNDSYILDVGCGVGVTACYIARQVGCRVMGVDIMPRMVERSRQRAKREKLEKVVEFREADAQDLPFEEALFDAVITESVTAFPEDKQKTVNEYVRVTKPGGYVGLNETCWLKYPPPSEVVAWAAQDVGASVKPLTPETWTDLLVTAGLKNITAKTYAINTQTEAKGILQRYGLGESLKIMSRMLKLYLMSPAYRKFTRSVRQDGVIPHNLAEYFGYGLFVGQKT
jgi:ubiquinone/menaquinone biosynthesis C-methylase UbiE